MRVLLDENVPSALARELPRHFVRTVQRMRWSGLNDKELLRRTVRNFDVLVTIDSSIEHQQRLPSGLALIVLLVANNKPETVLPLAPAIRLELETLAPGDISHLGAAR